MTADAIVRHLDLIFRKPTEWPIDRLQFWPFDHNFALPWMRNDLSGGPTIDTRDPFSANHGFKMSFISSGKDDDYMPRATVNSVAIWIVDQVRRKGALDNAVAIFKIKRLFGADFIVFDQYSGPRLHRALFNAVRRISRGSVVYIPERRSFGKAFPVEPVAARVYSVRELALAV